MRWLTSIAVLAIPVLAQAQAFRGTLIGRVTSQGKALARVTVRIDSDVIQTTRVTLTSARGTYWAGQLPPGTYRVAFAHAGTQTVTRTAQIRLAETSRLDADLQPSEEGESVTVTTTTRSILERPEIVTSIERSLSDQLPIAREVTRRIALAPGFQGGAVRRSTDNLFVVDGVVQHRRGADVEVEDAIATEALVSTSASPEFGRFTGGVIAVATEKGGNTFTGSIRDTLTSGRWTAGASDRSTASRVEATIGGRIIRDALWFFLAGENATASDRERSMSAKLTATAGTRDTLVLDALRASRPDETRSAADLVHVLNRYAILTAAADMNRAGDFRDRYAAVGAEGLVPARSGDHDIAVGVQDFRGSRAVYANDSWTDGIRWTLSGGARYDEHLGTSPRAGVVYDLRDDHGAHLSATWSRFASETDDVRETALAWGQRVLTSGFVRAVLVKRTYATGIRYEGIEADARGQYLFLNFGGSGTIGEHVRAATAWVTGSPPAVEQHIDIALLERYRGGLATDVALQYRFGRYSVQPFAKVDILNLFDRALPPDAADDPIARRRSLRVAVGARY